MMYDIYFSARGKRDYKKVIKSEHHKKVKALIELIKENPYFFPPYFELLSAKDIYSRRINIQHRLLYRVNEKEKYIEILSCWTHYHE